ncbi:MAG: hypothetical protein HW386_899 [Gammaproteobacteria bacterium]|nr:hypothetical protein [Gammaproteobacteria bacterium]
MLPKDLLDITEKEKNALWNKFTHEDALLAELEYYQDKIKAMERPVTMLDIAVLTIYKHHVQNIENLLSRLHVKTRNPFETKA